MSDRDDSWKGRMIGRYRLDGELGRGGMGIVYAAFDTVQQRAVALKVIAPEIARDEAFAARFLREARIAVSLEHPNVVPVYETGSDKGSLFIAMRCVDGADLGAVVRGDRALELERVVRLARQIGSALDAAHAKGLVHRDVKPGNVLLTGSGDEEHAYLTDFGLAREAASDTGLTNTGQWMGTADYVAPEQVEGGTVSARTDIYSFGCVLFELLTGDVPYPGLLVRKLYAHARDPLPSIGRAAGAHSKRIDAVLARATAKDPNVRHPSAGDVARALAAAASGRAVSSAERSVAVGAALIGMPTDAEAARGKVPPRRRAPDPAAAPPGARKPASAKEPSQAYEPAPTRKPVAAAPRARTAVAPEAAARREAPDREGGRRTVLALSILVALLIGAGAAGIALLPRDLSGEGRVSTTVTIPGEGGNGGETGTNTSETPTGTSPVASPPAPPPNPQTKDLEDELTPVIREFFQTQIDGNYGALRKLTTRRYREDVIDKLGFLRWVGNQTTGSKWFRGASNIEVEIVDTDPADDSVTVELTGMRYIQPGSRCRRWEGVTWIKKEDGVWTMDPDRKATARRRSDWDSDDLALIGEAGRCIRPVNSS